jgi:hypothetical protein
MTLFVCVLLVPAPQTTSVRFGVGVARYRLDLLSRASVLFILHASEKNLKKGEMRKIAGSRKETGGEH